MERATAPPLDRLHRLARRLQRAARSGDLESLGGILEERRVVLERLADDGDPSDPRERDRILRDVLAMDRETESALRRQGETMQAELAALGRGRRGLSGYGGGPSAAPKCIDEQG